MGDRLKDKVALVTGAGSSGPGWGNGKATAVLLAREGVECERALARNRSANLAVLIALKDMHRTGISMSLADLHG
jgi:NAD(P)-dependent dehydrogenase (short-subunit alcohol dehydrogenase family)